MKRSSLPLVVWIVPISEADLPPSVLKFIPVLAGLLMLLADVILEDLC